MFNNTTVSFVLSCLLAIPLLAFAASSDGDEKRALSREEVLALLPQGPDMLDDVDAQRYQALLEMGERAYSGLLDVVEVSTNYITTGRALAVLRESTGDKSEAVSRMKHILVEKATRHGKEADRILMQLAEALGEIGNASDMKALYPLIDHSNERVRIISIRAVARRGGAEALTYLTDKEGKNHDPASQAEIRKAISALQERTSRSPQQTEQKK